MADNEEDYINVDELETEEEVMKESNKKPSFGSKFKSTFKGAGKKVSAGASSLAKSGGEAAKKGYASYRASQTPEAKQKRYDAELSNVKQQMTLAIEKAKLAKVKGSSPQQNNIFGGGMGMGGMNRDSSGGFGSTLPGMNNPMGGSSVGRISDPFSGNMGSSKPASIVRKVSRLSTKRVRKSKSRRKSKKRSTTKKKKVLSMKEFEREQKYKKYLSSVSRSKQAKTTTKRKVAKKKTRKTKKRRSSVSKPQTQSNQMHNPFG